MSGERYVVIGVANVRSNWFTDVARWATSGSLPIEFVQCVSVAEARALLSGSRPYSCLMFDVGVSGADRDLVDIASGSGTVAVAIADGDRIPRAHELGVVAVLNSEMTRGELLDTLANHATMISRGDANVFDLASDDEVVSAWRGRQISVVGSGGSGTSVIAMALAQGLSSDVTNSGLVLLADLALNADQAMYHHTGDVVPGLPELVDLYRAGRPGSDQVRSLMFDAPGRSYRVLLGLRRQREWSGLRPRLIESALDGLARNYRTVVHDITADFEGEAETGSVDIEERNALARASIASSDLVVAVMTPTAKGLHSFVRLISDLGRADVAVGRILPIVNLAPRSPKARAEISRTLATLTRGTISGHERLAGPVFVGHSRKIDSLIATTSPLPVAFVGPIANAVTSMLENHAPLTTTREPEPILPGSLSSEETA